MGEDKGDQLPLNRLLEEETKRGALEATAARGRAQEKDRVLNAAGEMTTSIPLPRALEEAAEAERLARTAEAQLRALNQDMDTLNVPPPTGHIKRAGHHNSGRHSTKVPLHLLGSLPGMEDASPLLTKGGK